LRDSFGLAVDTLTNPLNHQDNMRIRNTAYALEQIDRRVAVMAVESLMSGDPYIFTREAYLQQRQYLVSDGQIEDWDDDWGDWD
jgi:phospholipid-binding lipoprotein MlaA